MIAPYKRRVLDRRLRARVYRNLHDRGGERWSIMQRGKVVAHADEVYLYDACFVVNRSGAQRARREGRKNVHAFVEGEIMLDGFAADDRSDVTRARYDLTTGRFVATSGPRSGQAVTIASVARLDADGLHLYGCVAYPA